MLGTEGKSVLVLDRDRFPRWKPCAGGVTAKAAPYVPEPLRVRVRPGLEVSVRIDGIDDALAGRVRSVSHEAVFTPYYALTERDRSRLAYLAEVDLVDPHARDLPTGIPVEVVFGSDAAIAVSEAASDD